MWRCIFISLYPVFKNSLCSASLSLSYFRTRLNNFTYRRSHQEVFGTIDVLVISSTSSRALVKQSSFSEVADCPPKNLRRRNSFTDIYKEFCKILSEIIGLSKFLTSFGGCLYTNISL